MEKDNNKKEECPLCQVSDETLDRLKGKDEKKSPQEKNPVKKKKGLFGKLYS